MRAALFWIAVVITIAPLPLLLICAVIVIAQTMGWWAVPALAWVAAATYVTAPFNQGRGRGTWHHSVNES